MPNIELEPVGRVATFRKIAIGTWRDCGDPSVYGTMIVPMDKAMDYLDAFRERTGRRLTVTHMLAKAMAAAFERVPEANSILRFNRPWRRKKISIFFQVALESDGEGEADLSGAKLDEVDTLDLVQIVDAFEQEVKKVRGREDAELERTRGTFRFIPYFLLNAFINMLSFLSYTLNLDLTWAGVPNDPFGSIMITNIGSLGLDMAYAPLVPYSKVPMVLAAGAVTPMAVVEDDQIVIRRQMKLSVTFDHRFLDGVHAAIMARVVKKWFSDPEAHFGPIPEQEAPAEAPPSDD